MGEREGDGARRKAGSSLEAEILRCSLSTKTLEQRERKMLPISKDALPYVAVVLGGRGERRQGRSRHIHSLCILLLC